MLILSKLQLNDLTSPEDTTKAKFIKYFSDKTVVFNNQIITGLLLLKPGFHYTANATTTTQKQSDCKVEQSSFTLIALFSLKVGRCRGRNWLNGNQAFRHMVVNTVRLAASQFSKLNRPIFF